MDLPSFPHSSFNNVTTQIDSNLYQFVQEPQDPILAPLPSTLDMASYYCMNQPDLMNLSNSLADLMNTQRIELEQYMKLQSEWLRAGLMNQSEQHMLSLTRFLECKASVLLSQKDEELSKVKNQVLTLRGCLKKEMEDKVMWKKIAKEKESMVIALSRSWARIVEDVGSSINVERVKQFEGERFGLMPCKACGSGYACMLLIPCRHLCACKNCAASLDACPVCCFKKTYSIEVSLE